MEWVVHPLKRNVFKSVSLIVFLVLICILIYISYKSILLSVVSGILLFGSLRNFFLKTRYRLLEENIEIITAFGRKVYSWEIFKSYYPDKNGVLLSPFPQKSWLENFRGVYLLFNNNASLIIEFIKRKIKLPT